MGKVVTLKWKRDREKPISSVLNDADTVETNIQIINRTGKVICYATRNNLIIEIPPNPRDLIDGTIQLRQEVAIPNRQSDGLAEAMVKSTVSDIGSCVLKEANEVRCHLKPKIVYSREIDVAYSEVEELGGLVYNSDLDILLSVLPKTQTPHHPYSQLGIRDDLFTLETDRQRKGLSVDLFKVDNSGMGKDEYLPIGKEVFRVPVISDVRLEEGTYMVGSQPMARDGSRPVGQEIRRLDEMDHNPVFGTYSEALDHTDIETRATRHLDELKHQREVELEELKREKLNSERELLTLKNTTNETIEAYKKKELRLNHETELRNKEIEEKKRKLEERLGELEEQRKQLEHKRSIEAMEAKSYYESRSHERKDSSEGLKTLTAIVGAGVTLFAALKLC